MAGARLDDGAVFGLKNCLAEGQRLGRCARMHVDATVCADANNRCQDLRRYAVGGLAVDDRVEPRAIVVVTLGVAAEGVQEDVDVRQNHERPSSRSMTALESSRSTPGCVPPVARDTGSVMRARRPLARPPASTSLSPRSISAVTVSPLRAASAFASRRSPSSKRTVVLMHHSMHALTYVCQRIVQSVMVRNGAC